MKTNARIVMVSVFAVCSLTVVPTLRAQPVTSLAPAYRVVDLGFLPGGPDSSWATSVNDAGQVIGTSGGVYPAGKEWGFIWDATNGMVNLGSFGGIWADANGLNNHGVVVGSSAMRPFRWTKAVGMQDLGSFGSYPYYGAFAVNDTGAIGYANWSYSGPPGRGYLLSGGTATWIGELYPGGWTIPRGINNKNEMIGGSTTSSGSPQAFYWNVTNGIVGLGTLPGYSLSNGNGINDASQGVGYCFNSGGNSTAFLWTPGTGMTQLSSDGIGGSNSSASAISAGGIAVGGCTIAGTSHAVAWAPGQNAVDLNTLVTNLSGWLHLSAKGINAAGVIVGSGVLTNGVNHAFILYPIVVAPSITNQPASATVSSGGTATLTVGVAGTPPFTYQWQFNGTNLSGATNASLSITNFSVANAGGYSVIVSNSVGGVSSRIATLASVDIAMFAGVIVNGPLGSNYLIQAASSLAPTNWMTLTNVALPAQPYIYIDYTSPTNSKQFYRALPQ